MFDAMDVPSYPWKRCTRLRSRRLLRLCRVLLHRDFWRGCSGQPVLFLTQISSGKQAPEAPSHGHGLDHLGNSLFNRIFCLVRRRRSQINKLRHTPDLGDQLQHFCAISSPPSPVSRLAVLDLYCRGSSTIWGMACMISSHPKYPEAICMMKYFRYFDLKSRVTSRLP